jgi:hypothetical protein
MRRVAQGPGTFSSSCAALARVATSTDLHGLGSGERYRRTTTINMLPDNVLLEIFDFDNYWSHEWKRLVHVCQRWRHIIFASPLRLDLTLLCSYGTPVRKNLGYWPSFPIIVDYLTWNGTGRALDYEVDITAALEHRDRIRSIKLAVTGSLLGILTSVMQEPFLALTDLWLSSKDSDMNAPFLPEILLGGSAPSLREIYLVGVSFPALPTLLLSANDLVCLRLEDIPQGGYISPEAMVTVLAASTRLDSLWIRFKSPTSRLELISLPFLTRDVLLSLTSFNFRGSSEYLERLLVRIDTPRLQCFEITYFNQLDFFVPRLSQFIGRTANLELAQCRRAQARFHINDVSLELGEGHSPSRLILHISCKWVDWQVSHLARILGQSPAIVAGVVHLYIVDMHLEPGWQDDIDDIDWLQLFRPFTAVKKLHGSEQLARHIALALDAASGEMVTEVLPDLVLFSLEAQPLRSSDHSITTRQLSGRRVIFVNPDIGEFYVLWRLFF